ncbi:STAS-like domain-containing protein [Methylocystis sp. FS]|uniref:STAS-like domain-containing protein n=1 Tax=Methylocystis silviterrae TaxID=2743612 RepID=UPI001581FB14|nr:STAS-like domain-containing protein [Methylocystis silviterrae]NUJ80657.1 STAS-like domain-containing protein [Methylocystis silviterrae]
MVIIVADIIVAADTEEQGTRLYASLIKALGSHDVATVSFAGLDTATSSFVNASFVPLLDAMPFVDLKRRLRIVASTRQINEMIKSRLSAEAVRGEPPKPFPSSFSFYAGG